jgi:hypothetical protein
MSFDKKNRILKQITALTLVLNNIDKNLPRPTDSKKSKAGDKSKQEFLLSELSHIHLFVEVLDKITKESQIIPKYLPVIKLPTEDIIRSSWLVYDNLCKHHGLKVGSKLWKEFRNYTLRQARGQPPGNLSVITSTGNSDRVISKFHNLRPYIFASRDGCAKAYQVLNSILYSSRIDVRSPDTKKYSVEDVLYHFRCNPLAVEKYRSWLKSKINSGAFILDEIPKGKFELEVPLTSSSPRGGLNISTLEVQAYDLTKSSLFNPFKNICEYFGDADLPRYVQSIAERLEKEHPNLVAKTVRRITRIPDSDVKDRVIAIVDWCSQIVAARVQGMLYKFLKRNLLKHTDVFDHNLGAIKVLNADSDLSTFASPGTEYILKCTDFDAWTWKFSKEPQIVFMEEVFGKGISDPFTPLILDCVWSTDKLKTGFESVKAGSGQAMGSKASFILATVTSVTLIMAACDGIFDEFLPEQHKNMLLESKTYEVPCKAVFSETGDDIVLYDYNNRIESCLLLFGNTINESKSVYSTDYPSGEITRFTEYLSRVSLNHKECSRVSLKLCRLAVSHYTYVPHLLSHLWEREVGLLDASSFDQVWVKKSGPTKDKHGTSWSDNLKSLMTLSNPTRLPHEHLVKLCLIDEKYEKSFIETFPLRECLLLVEETLSKMEKTSTDLNKHKDLLRNINKSEERILVSNEQDVSVLDIYYSEYLERTQHIVNDIKKFIYERSDKVQMSFTAFYLSPYIIPGFMKEENLNETLLNLNLEDSKDELELFIKLLVKDARSVDGSYPSFSDRSKHYRDISSLTLRTLNAKSLSFERLDAQIVLQSGLEPVHRVGWNPGNYPETRVNERMPVKLH